MITWDKMIDSLDEQTVQQHELDQTADWRMISEVVDEEGHNYTLMVHTLGQRVVYHDGGTGGEPILLSLTEQQQMDWDNDADEPDWLDIYPDIIRGWLLGASIKCDTLIAEWIDGSGYNCSPQVYSTNDIDAWDAGLMGQKEMEEDVAGWWHCGEHKDGQDTEITYSTYLEWEDEELVLHEQSCWESAL